MCDLPNIIHLMDPYISNCPHFAIIWNFKKTMYEILTQIQM